MLSDQLDYLLVVVEDTLILQTVLVQIMVVLEVEVMVKILRMQLEKHLEFTEPEAVEVVAPPAENLVVLVSLSFIILGHN
tara:strand:- start:38 stop:277 length:240 start_codon:yes stop_codon:yes gene_type:complete